MLTFTVTDEEHKKANEWVEKHKDERHKGRTPYAGAVGGAFSWSFVHTSLGLITTLKCMCGEECCVTDFGDW